MFESCEASIEEKMQPGLGTTPRSTVPDGIQPNNQQPLPRLPELYFL